MVWKNLKPEEVAEYRCVKDWFVEAATRRTGSEGTRSVYLNRLTDCVMHACGYRGLHAFLATNYHQRTQP